MAERRNTRSRHTNGDRYFHNERRQKDGERYERNGPLSPLRSPINRDKRVSHRNERTDSNRYSKGSLNFKIKENEFPPLSDPQMTPEIGPIKFSSSKFDWATQVEKFEELAATENENLKTYRRKLEMGEERKQRLILDMEDDQNILIRRQKAIDYGKNTSGYESFITKIKRQQRQKVHPQTPNKYVKTSRRSWDMQVKLWRRSLHQFDPPSVRDANSVGSTDISMTDASSECSGHLEKTFDSDISDNGSELLDYRHTLNNENFLHHFPETETPEPSHSSPKNTLSLIDETDIDRLML